MNYNNKNQKETIENDELNIKSHLNTSLDLSGISVSEDLINRTLAAIKEQSEGNMNETETETKEFSKKIIPWNRYIRGFAGVAAAVIIVAIGYNIVQQGPIGMKKAEDKAMPEYTASQQENTTMMATTEEAPAAADTSTAMKKGEEDIQYTITAETADTSGIEESKVLDAAEADSSALADNSALADSAATEQQDAAGTESNIADAGQIQRFATISGNNDNVATYSFRDIFLASPEQAEYVTISDNVNNISITLTQLEDIQAFYTIMDSHQFTMEGNDSLIDPNYTIEVNSPELGTLYTMLVGSNLTVRLTQGDNVVENTYYAVDDATFKQELEEFLIERSE
ncbi:MAG: hypothetical protein H6Q59_129 [Firmicutes bacterium]|nr:hypothetical protein [Bacillota bacterium]